MRRQGYVLSQMKLSAIVRIRAENGLMRQENDGGMSTNGQDEKIPKKKK